MNSWSLKQKPLPRAGVKNFHLETRVGWETMSRMLLPFWKCTQIHEQEAMSIVGIQALIEKQAVNP